MSQTREERNAVRRERRRQFRLKYPPLPKKPKKKQPLKTKRGALTYEGRGCYKCQNTTRYQSSHRCVACEKIRQSSKYKRRKEKHPIFNRPRMKRGTVGGKMYMKEYMLLRNYGMTLEDFNRMMTNQKGVCAICHDPLTSANVDHDHSCCPGKLSCGKCIRDLLCGPCNKMIAFAKDNPLILRSGAAYVEAIRPYPRFSDALVGLAA